MAPTTPSRRKEPEQMTRISKVKKSLTKWRQKQNGKLRDLPIELRSQAVRLLDSYSWDDVSEQLGVSKSTLSHWRKSTKGNSITPRVPEVIDEARHGRPKVSSDASQFVEVMECMVDVPGTKGPALTVTLEMPNGVSLCVDGPMDRHFVQGLVQVVCEARVR
jgi:hypothetical protein